MIERVPVQSFVGRNAILTAIEASLLTAIEASLDYAQQPLPVLYFEGQGGIGKTRLIHEAHQISSNHAQVLSTGVIDLYHIHYHQPVLLMNTIVERLSDGRGSILGDGRNCLLLLVVQLFPQLKEYRVGSVLDDPETLMMDTALLADLFDYPDEKKTGAQRENAGSRRAPRQQHRRDCALCELPWLTADYHRRARGEAGAMQGAAQVYAAPGSRPVRPGICVCGAVLLMVTFLSF